jgi:hypothetical protein
MVTITKREKMLILVFGIVLIAILTLSIFLYVQWSKLKEDSNTISKKEVSSLVEKVGKLIVLPTDETPTIATVSDPEKLKDQPFFAHAKLGDKVLIYTNNKKAVIYDPDLNKIVEVAPISLGGVPTVNPTSPPTPDTTTPPTKTSTSTTKKK